MGTQRVRQQVLQLRVEIHEGARPADEPGLYAFSDYFVDF
jgi:hypothetical protein